MQFHFFLLTAQRFNPLRGVSHTPGGTRTPNRRFWRPLLYQLSYWRKFTLPVPLPINLLFLPHPQVSRIRERVLIQNVTHPTGADGLAAFTNGEADRLFHCDWRDQLDFD